jgi:hypothetical protein
MNVLYLRAAARATSITHTVECGYSDDARDIITRHGGSSRPTPGPQSDRRGRRLEYRAGQLPPPALLTRRFRHGGFVFAPARGVACRGVRRDYPLRTACLTPGYGMPVERSPQA